MQQQQLVQRVAIADRVEHGDAKCDICGTPVWSRVPTNYPQVCHDCADEQVWHYCDRVTAKGE
jgi:hypothetical protein